MSIAKDESNNTILNVTSRRPEVPTAGILQGDLLPDPGYREGQFRTAPCEVLQHLVEHIMNWPMLT